MQSKGSPPDDRPWPPALQSIAAARTGDRIALGVILDGGHPRIFAFYRAMGLSHADASDLAADTCEGVVRRIGDLRDPERFEAWFWTIARNRFRSHLRNRGRVRFGLVGVPPATPEDLAVDHDEHAAVRRAFDSLADRDRELLWMREVEGLDHAAIGRRLGLPAGAVRVAFHRARTRLVEAYREMGGTDE
ncbi:MAG: sigma-70 family RNA polymerase sigma factor [Acidimicrobiia bacterium]|jgi:RNA polymerase sigma factor (sigma-70 family)